MKGSISRVMLMTRLGLLLATTVCFGQGYTVTDLGTLSGDSRSCGYGMDECGQVVGINWGSTYLSVHPFQSPDALRAGIPAKGFSVVTPEDIEELCRVAIERSDRPSHEGHLFLEFKSGGLRQYVTLTLALGLLGSVVAIERVDFIQERWQVNVLHQDQIDQWVVSANGNGTARYVCHKRLLEDKGAVLKEEFLPTDEDGAKAIVEKIAARFLPSNREPPILSATAIMPTADGPESTLPLNGLPDRSGP
jgi:hypothetical protein